MSSMSADARPFTAAAFGSGRLNTIRKAPVEMRVGGGVTKRLLRESMAGLAPEANVWRRDKLSLAPYFRRGLVHEDRDRVVDALSDLHPALARTIPPRRAKPLNDSHLQLIDSWQSGCRCLIMWPTSQ